MDISEYSVSDLADELLFRGYLVVSNDEFDDVIKQIKDWRDTDVGKA